MNLNSFCTSEIDLIFNILKYFIYFFGVRKKYDL